MTAAKTKTAGSLSWLDAKVIGDDGEEYSNSHADVGHGAYFISPTFRLGRFQGYSVVCAPDRKHPKDGTDVGSSFLDAGQGEGGSATAPRR